MRDIQAGDSEAFRQLWDAFKHPTLYPVLQAAEVAVGVDPDDLIIQIATRAGVLDRTRY